MDIQEIINYYTSQLPDSMKSKPWSFTNHGKDVLQTEEQLNAYIAAYGEMHTIKCRAALQNFPFDGLTNYEIVDWGCGQGIATLTYMRCCKNTVRYTDYISYDLENTDKFL